MMSVTTVPIPFGVHPDDEKVERDVTVDREIGTLCLRDGRYYSVVECYPKASMFGPRWDLRLKLVSPDIQLAAEVMLT
jgi:hypothetical protein